MSCSATGVPWDRAASHREEHKTTFHTPLWHTSSQGTEQGFFLALQPNNRRKNRFALLPPMDTAFVPQRQATRGTLCTRWHVVSSHLRLPFLKSYLKNLTAQLPSEFLQPTPLPMAPATHDLFFPKPRGLLLLKACAKTSSTWCLQIRSFTLQVQDEVGLLGWNFKWFEAHTKWCSIPKRSVWNSETHKKTCRNFCGFSPTFF